MEANWQIISWVAAGIGAVGCAVPGVLRNLQPLGVALGRLSRYALICAVLVGGISILADVAVALWQGFPQPRVQDEFSYLLAADTFAHGRLTNPSPPFWEHFETPHVLVRPTYMSKYPPAQGMALALGQVLAGAAIVGVWLSAAAAAMAIYWMLLAFVTPGWALLGGIVAALHPQLLAWGHVYWGGSVAVLGAALMLGAWGRLMRDSSIGAAIVLGIGLGILANSRPYEGLVVSLPLLVGLLLRVCGPHLPSPGTPDFGELSRTGEGQGEGYFSDPNSAPTPALPRSTGGGREGRLTGRGGRNGARWPVLVALGGTLLIFAAWMGYYDFRITGHALRMPFVEYTRQYDVYPKFWFLPKRPTPQYHDDVMRDLHMQWERGDYDRMRSPGGAASVEVSRLGQLARVPLQPLVLIIPLVAAAGLWRRERFGWLWLTLGVFVVGIGAESWFLPHYAAPVVPLVLLLVVSGSQWLWNVRGGKDHLGKILIFAVFCGFFGGSIAWMAGSPSEPPRFGRAELIANYPQLQTGQHLIFVRYLPGHLLDDEWVYNKAELAQSGIIWARAMGGSDYPLIQYFAGRHAWLLEVGEDQLTLNNYPASH